jgi:hypothetical protein
MSGFDNGGAAPPPPPPPSAGGGGAIPQRGIGDILTTAFELYRANAAKLITIVAIVVVPLTLLISILTVSLQNNVEEVANSLQVNTETGQISATTTSGTSFGNFILLGLLTALLAAVIQQLLTGAITKGAAGSLLGRPVDVKASYSYALSRLWGLIGLAILVGLAVGVGFVLLIVPGVIILVFLAVSTPSFVIERLGVTASMPRSWNLVRGSWWHTLGVIAVTYVIIWVVSAIFGAIGGSTFIGVWITSAAAQIITAPFMALVSVVMYVDLRSRHEALTAEALGAQLD